jgi:hypothetical protein
MGRFYHLTSHCTGMSLASCPLTGTQIYEIPVHIISSIWDPPIVEFNVLYQKKEKPRSVKIEEDQALKTGVRFLESSEVKERPPEGVVTLVGFDGRAVRCYKTILMRSPTIANFVQEALGNRVLDRIDCVRSRYQHYHFR